ncbi:MAG: hypothetical protein EHM70_02100 [Chloroflexota bacterium]|nr:MAG: hypothetical protein EHM70_02100 [Chloroflexota bacterium]
MMGITMLALLLGLLIPGLLILGGGVVLLFVNENKRTGVVVLGIGAAMIICPAAFFLVMMLRSIM